MFSWVVWVDWAKIVLSGPDMGHGRWAAFAEAVEGSKCSYCLWGLPNMIVQRG